VNTIVLFDQEDRHDVRVIECGQRFRFAHQTPETLRVVGHLSRQYLEGHSSVELRILGEIHLSHTATA